MPQRNPDRATVSMILELPVDLDEAVKAAKVNTTETKQMFIERQLRISEEVQAAARYLQRADKLRAKGG